MKKRALALALLLVLLASILPETALAYIGAVRSYVQSSSDVTTTNVIYSGGQPSGLLMATQSRSLRAQFTYNKLTKRLSGNVRPSFMPDNSAASPSRLNMTFREGRWGENDQLRLPSECPELTIESAEFSAERRIGYGNTMLIEGKLSNGSNYTIRIWFESAQQGEAGATLPIVGTGGVAATLPTDLEDLYDRAFGLHIQVDCEKVISGFMDCPVIPQLNVEGFGRAGHRNEKNNGIIIVGNGRPQYMELNEIDVWDDGVTEVHESSWLKFNEYIAMGRYDHAGEYGNVVNVPGHESTNKATYGKFVQITNYGNKEPTGQMLGDCAVVTVSGGGGENNHFLYGMRNMCTEAEYNALPEDEKITPPIFTEAATALGVIRNSATDTYSIVTGTSAAALRTAYPDKLVVTFSGLVERLGNRYSFYGGATQIGISSYACWSSTTQTAGLSLWEEGGKVKITAKSVKLATPSFVYFSPKSGATDGLTFRFDGPKMYIDVDPNKNAAKLHPDIPGAVGTIKSVTEDSEGNLVFSGNMAVRTLPLNLMDMSVSHLKYGRDTTATDENGLPLYTMTGMKAKGSVDLGSVIGMSIAHASADIDTIEHDYYKFNVGFDVYVLSGEGDLELCRLESNGALIPNDFSIKFSTNISDVGIPIVSPVVIGKLNGATGGFSNLADTLNGDFYGLPPLRLTIGGKLKILEVIDGWAVTTVGLCYLSNYITDATLLDYPVIKSYTQTSGLTAGKRTYNGHTYKGSYFENSWDLNIATPKESEVIRAYAHAGWKLFAGVDDDNVYMMLGADAAVGGSVHIPNGWPIIGGMQVLNAAIALSLSAETAVSRRGGTIVDKVCEMIRNGSIDGSLTARVKILLIPVRVTYLFKDRDVDITLKKSRPINTTINDALENGQVLAEIQAQTMQAPSRAARSRAATGIDGVTITRISDKKYQVTLDFSKITQQQLVFANLQPTASGDVSNTFLGSLQVTNAQRKSLDLHIYNATEYDADDSRYDQTNMLVSPSDAAAQKPSGDCTLFLGGYNVDTNGDAFSFADFTVEAAEAFELTIGYSKPFASFDSVTLNGNQLRCVIKDYNELKQYDIRVYLTDEGTSADTLVTQVPVTHATGVNSVTEDITIPTTGGITPSGSYKVKAVLVEHVSTVDRLGETLNGLATCDSKATLTALTYVNDEAPAAPTNVTLTATGSAVLRAGWQAPINSPVQPDGYTVTVYRLENGQWVNKAAAYEVTRDANGEWQGASSDGAGGFTLDMALTISGDASETGAVAVTDPLKVNETYRVSVVAFVKPAAVEGLSASGNLNSPAAYSPYTGVLLPQPRYPAITYVSDVRKTSESVKLVTVNGGGSELTLYTDVPCQVKIVRQDTGAVVGEMSGVDSGNHFRLTMPLDFDGSINLKIIAAYLHDGLTDMTTDYITLHKDDQPPILVTDNASYSLGANGRCTITGTTEPYTRVALLERYPYTDTYAPEVYSTSDGRFSYTFDGRVEDFVPGQIRMLRAVDPSGNQSFTSVLLHNTPTIVSGPESQWVFIGEQATFTIQCNDPGVTYQWQRKGSSDWEDIPSATGVSYTTPAATLADNGMTLRCLLRDARRQVTPSSEAVLHVSAKPPHTGDSATPASWLLMLMLTASFALLLLRHGKRRSS